MIERHPKKVSRRILIWFGLFAIVVMIGATIYAAISVCTQPNGTIPKQLVGTWRSVRVGDDPHGVDSIWDLRDDGTARWRLSSSKTLGNAAGYFEWWTEDPDVFTMHQYSSKSAATKGRLISTVLGLPVGGRTDSKLVEVSENEFKIRSKDGKVATYRRTEDSTLSAVP